MMDKTKDETEDMGYKGHVLRRHFLSPFQDPRAALRFGLGYIIAPFWGFGENPGAPGLNIFEVGDRMCKRPPAAPPRCRDTRGLNMDVVCMAYPTECVLRRVIGKKTCDFGWFGVSSSS